MVQRVSDRSRVERTRSVPERIREIETPSSIGEYKTWLEKEHGAKVNDRTKNHYESVALKVARDFEKSAFWTTLLSRLEVVKMKVII